MNHTSTIGIIGGADGPTTVFVAGKLGSGSAAGMVIVGIIVIAAAILIYKWRKK